MGGKDASEAEAAMRKITEAKDFMLADWSWDELDGWLKTTKLAPDRKAAIAKIIGDLKGKDYKPVPKDRIRLKGFEDKLNTIPELAPLPRLLK